MTSSARGFYIGLVKWRNQLIALFCLFVFLGFGVLYFRYWVVQKPFGIILFIGEGLDAETLAAARLHAGSALAIDSLPYTAFLKNASADAAIPDPAAAATALATGMKIRNRGTALDSEGRPLPSILALAQDAGRLTGLITDGDLTAPTVACFYAQPPGKDEPADLADQLVESSEIDLVLGRGQADFLPKSQGGRRADEKDLLSAARERGYQYVQSVSELDAVPRWRRVRLLGLFDGKETEERDENKNSGTNPTLPDIVRRAIELLQYHRGGYVLVVDASAMRAAVHVASREQRMAAALEFDRAVAVAKEYTGEKSAIFVTGDVADPPISEPSKAEKDEEIAGLIKILPNAWLPASEDADVLEKFSLTPLLDNDAATSTATATPKELPKKKNAKRTEIVEDIPAFGKGLGADLLHGTMENTDLFEIIRDNL